MKTTIRAVISAAPAMSKLSGENLSLRLAYRLKKSIAELQKEAEFFNEQRSKILDKYGKPDGKGNYTFEGNNGRAVNAELDELLNMEVEPNVDALKIPISDDIRLSANDILLLEPFIVFEEDGEMNGN